MTARDLAELFGEQPATEHRPNDRRSFMREAARLRASGLTPADIATALGLTTPTVRDLLREHDTGSSVHSTHAPGRRHPR